jgi:hypothetical protein
MMSCIGPIVTVGYLAPRAQHAVTKNASMRAFFSGMEVEFWIFSPAWKWSFGF